MLHKTIFIFFIALFMVGCSMNTPVAPSITPTVTVIETPTVTLTPQIPETLTLEKIKTNEEIIGLKNQNQSFLQNNTIDVISTLFSTFAIPLTAILGFCRWRADQHIERKKREEDYEAEQTKLDEERFQAVVEGLGSDRVEARVGAAVMLLTFLNKGYEKFYSQTFLLAVAHLRLRKSEQNIPEPLDALSQALIIVLKESFSKARDNMPHFTPESLDAMRVHLDNAYLSKTDLKKIYMRDASLRGAYFWMAHLQGAYLKHSDLEKAFLANAHLEDANLGDTTLTGANLSEAHLQRTGLHGARLNLADLTNADLTNANLSMADFTNANLTGTHPEHAKSLQGTILRGVKGLSVTQLAECAARGAIIDNKGS